MRLYKVTLSCGGYDTYDSAVIACESKEVLEELLDTEFDLYHDSPNVEFQQDFCIRSQCVESIEGIGYTDMESDKKAVVIISSFNAG